jgi:hypothetical protein
MRTGRGAKSCSRLAPVVSERLAELEGRITVVHGSVTQPCGRNRTRETFPPTSR